MEQVKYDTKAWIVDALTDYAALECMPQETVALINSGLDLSITDLLECLRQELDLSAAKKKHFQAYSGHAKYGRLE